MNSRVPAKEGSMPHEVYQAIVNAVETGVLREPFSQKDFRNACPGFGEGTYNAFLWNHAEGNGYTTELFTKVAPGLFRCLRPFRYGG